MKKYSLLLLSVAVALVLFGLLLCVQAWAEEESPGGAGPSGAADEGDSGEVNELPEPGDGYSLDGEKQIIPTRLLIIHSSTSTKMSNDAAHNIMNLINPTQPGYDPDDTSTWAVRFDVRTTAQIGAMDPEEIKNLIEEADIVFCHWIGTDWSYLQILNVIKDRPDILRNKPGKMFIMLEAGVELAKLSQIDGELIFAGVPDSDIDRIINDLKNSDFAKLEAWKTTYPQIGSWIDLSFYQAGKGTENYVNMYKSALRKYSELVDSVWQPEWDPDPYKVVPNEMLYREGRIFTSLAEYLAQYPHDTSKPTVGIVDYTSPMLAGNMDHFETLIKMLENKGLNVLPVVGAYSGRIGTQPHNIYSAMLKFFVYDPEDPGRVVSAAEYEANPHKYEYRIDALVSFFFFSLGSGFLDQTNRLLDNMNVPVFRAITSTKRTEGEWLASDDGLLWSDTYYQIAIPETQGIIEPIFMATTEKEIDPITGAEIIGYKAIPDRMEKLVNRIYNWIQLKYMDNADKKIGLIFYNYPPGKDNIGASYLNVPETILMILNLLKDEGYAVKDIPANVDELLELMFERGINVANWAPGVLEEMANNPYVILWDADEYKAWFETLHPIAKKQVIEGPVGYIEEITKIGAEYGKTDETARNATLKTIETWTKEMISLANTYPEKSQQAIELINAMRKALEDVVNNIDPDAAWASFYAAKAAFLELAMPGMTGWGEPPGNIMTVTKNGREYIVIPGILFGNIFIGPEPQRGWEADASKFYHSTVVPPPHNYLAWYAWVNTVYGADAQVHIGRHATYEWLPRKQVALASFDYSDIMIADNPSVYIYIVDGVGEGLQAKRRGLAVIVSHLTPPLKTTALYGGFLELKALIEEYEKASAANNPILMEAYAQEIRSKVSELNLGTDLGVNPYELCDEELVEEVSEYLKDLLQTLMPFGLHTFGGLWTDYEIALLATAMVSADGGVESPSLQRLLAQEMGWDFDNLTLVQAEQLNDQAMDWVLQLLKDEKTVVDLTDNVQLQRKLEVAMGYAAKIRASFSSELNSLIDALAGGYVTPSTGNDPIRNPGAIPTGKNFYAIAEHQLPTKVAWDLGKRLADVALAQLDVMPEKIAAVVWCVETARDDGTMVSFVLRILGVEPNPTAAWLGGGSVSRMIATPLSTLLSDLNKVRASLGLPPLTERPRIDVVVTTSGLFRDLFPRLLVNMDRAFRVALAASYNTIVAEYPALKSALDYTLQTLVDAGYPTTGTARIYGNDPIELNYIAKHWIELTLRYVNLGVSAEDAGEFAITRIFAPPVGDYGAGVNKAIEQPWTWETRDQVADVYLMRMSHSYSERVWGNPNLDLFKELLSGITVAYHSRSTNLYGVLDNDDYFDYFGGLSMAIEKVNNGQAPSLNVLYYANPANPQIMPLLQFMTREMRTRYFNPEWIQGMMNEGYSGARTIANKFVNHLWGWQVTNPDVVKDWMWQEVVDIYLNDKYGIGVYDWLSTGNRGFALIEIAGTLLTAAQKGFWNADEATLRQVANTWAQAIIQHGVGCGGTSCGNHEMFKWAVKYVDPVHLLALNDLITTATNKPLLTPEELARLLPQEQPDTPQAGSDTVQKESGITGDAPATVAPRVPQAGPVFRYWAQPLPTGQEEPQTDGLPEDEAESTDDEQADTDVTVGEERAWELVKEDEEDKAVPLMAYVGLALALMVLIGAAFIRYFKRS